MVFFMYILRSQGWASSVLLLCMFVVCGLVRGFPFSSFLWAVYIHVHMFSIYYHTIPCVLLLSYHTMCIAALISYHVYCCSLTIPCVLLCMCLFRSASEFQSRWYRYQWLGSGVQSVCWGVWGCGCEVCEGCEGVGCVRVWGVWGCGMCEGVRCVRVWGVLGCEGCGVWSQWW